MVALNQGWGRDRPSWLRDKRMQVVAPRVMLGQRVQGERSEYREMRRKETVGTNHKELACAFSSSLDFIPWSKDG